MNDQFRNILDNLPNVAPRSRLEPYTELIQALRQRKRSYREIARVLAANCGVRVSHSTLHEYVQRHMVKESEAFPGLESRPGDKQMTEEPDVRATIEQNEARKRIETLRRKPASLPEDPGGFQFDDSEPLRLRPEKSAPARSG
jgi:IS30 family transposase